MNRSKNSRLKNMSSNKRPKPRSKGFLPQRTLADSAANEHESSTCPRALFRESKHRGLPLGAFLKSADRKKLKLSAAILAGGKNSRMGGEDKAFLRFEGQPLIQRTIAVLKPIFSEICIVTNSLQFYDQYTNDAIIIEDSIKEMGPLGGIYSALSQARNEAVFFVACDMPFLHIEFIEQQIREFEKIDVDAFVPRIGDRVEPLHGIYHRKISAKLLSFLRVSQKRSIREFLQEVKTEYWDLDDTAVNRKYFTNVNTPEELQKLTVF